MPGVVYAACTKLRGLAEVEVKVEVQTADVFARLPLSSGVGRFAARARPRSCTMASVSLYPLASLEQIEKSPSREDGLPEGLEEDLRASGCKLIHQAGVLLKQ